MTERKIPFAWTLTAVFNISAAFYLVTFFFPIYVGAVCLLVALACAVIRLCMVIRKAFTFGSRYAADFVAGQTKRRKLAENPLMRDPFYASIITQIDDAKRKHKRINHLYAKRDHRVRELLGTKGMAQ